MARVLVTGASGFIGRHLVKYLAKYNHDVSCLVRRSSRTGAISRFVHEIIVGDVTDQTAVAQAVKNQDYVIHVAGVTKSFSSSQMFQVNAEGTRNVAAACANELSPPVMVHISSLAAAGPSRNGQPRVESDLPAPVSNYGKSKLAGEWAALQFCERIPLTILRPAIVLGEGDRDGLSLFSSIARTGIHSVPGSGRARFSVVHASDLVEAIRLLAFHGQRCDIENARGTYFVAGREAPSFADLGRMIGQSMDRESVRVIRNPRPVVWLVAAACETISRVRGRPFIMGFDKAREATSGSWYCDCSSLYELGFEPAPLAARLRQTTLWYQQRGWLPNPKSASANVFWRTSSSEH